MLNALLFFGAEFFEINDGNWCKTWVIESGGLRDNLIDVGDNGVPTSIELKYNNEYDTLADQMAADPVLDEDGNPHTTCEIFEWVCPENNNGGCFDDNFRNIHHFEYDCFRDTCLKSNYDYTHFTIIFNAFVWCQIFNEFNARSIMNDPNCFKNISRNHMFLLIILVTIASQVFIVGVGGDFTRTIMLDMNLWLYSIFLGFLSIPIGVAMRFVPIWSAEDPASFFGYDMPE